MQGTWLATKDFAMAMKTTTRTTKWTLADGAAFEFTLKATYPVADAPPPVVSPPIITPPAPAPAEVFLNPGDDVVAAARKATKETVIYLRDGAYGPLRFDGFRPPGKITLRSVNWRKARVQQVLLQNASDITLDGLAMWDDPADRQKMWTALVPQGDNSRFHVLDCEFRGHPDVDYFAWDKAKWAAAGGTGGNDSVDGSIRNCLVTGVGWGFQVGGNVVMEGNKLKGFCNDAYRAFGGAKVRGNYAADNFQVSANHNDLLQSFNLGGTPYEGMEIVGNTFVSWTGPTVHPLRAESIMCEGISFFDGFWNNLVIRDNLIVTDHWHGISVYGATNSVIEGNLVLNVFGKDAPHLGRPWIQLLPHKDGRPSDNVILRNNRAFAISIDPKNTRITQSGNVILTPAETQALLDANAARIRG
jgi:hypothetical protein